MCVHFFKRQINTHPWLVWIIWAFCTASWGGLDRPALPGWISSSAPQPFLEESDLAMAAEIQTILEQLEVSWNSTQWLTFPGHKPMMLSFQCFECGIRPLVGVTVFVDPLVKRMNKKWESNRAMYCNIHVVIVHLLLLETMDTWGEVWWNTSGTKHMFKFTSTSIQVFSYTRM